MPLCLALLGAGSGSQRHAPGRLLVVIGADDDEPAGDLLVLRDDGTERRQLTRMSVLTAAWSPDGRRVAFVAASNWSAGSSVWVVRADGGRPRQVVPERKVYIRSISWTPDGRQVRLYGPAASDSLASPDGTRIAFTRGRALWIKDADGRHARVLLEPQGADVVSLFRWQPQP